MRLHRPVHPQHQPHHAHSFAKTDTYASSGQDFASAGDKHASAGAGFHQGGIPADGRYSPNSIAVAGAGFAGGGSVRSDLDPPRSDMDSPLAPSQQSVSARPNRNASTSQRGPSAGGSALQSSGADDRDPAWNANNAFKARIARDSYPTGHAFDDGGLVPDNGLNPLSNILNRTGKAMGNANKPKPRPPDQGPTQEQGGPQRSSDTGSDMQVASADDGGSGGAYDDGGLVDPKAYMQWPTHLAGTPAGFADGGAVGGDLHPTHVAQLVAHSRDVYNDTHARMEAAFNAAQNGGGGDQGFAQGGGIPPAGPAGPGVKPQAPTGNAGRPNWTAPDPAKTASEKNYTQNVSSRPATSPARGTAFPQAGPDGGQRGQEWYGKGASPYGAGRKKQNGV